MYFKNPNEFKFNSILGRVWPSESKIGSKLGWVGHTTLEIWKIEIKTFTGFDRNVKYLLDDYGLSYSLGSRGS